MRIANLLLSWILLISLLWITNLKDIVAGPIAVTDPSGLWQAEMPSHCRELIKNGSFEEPNAEWDLLGSERPPEYQGDIANLKGQYALRLGNTDLLPNVPSSSVAEQIIFLPDDVGYIILDFHYYPISYDPDPGDGDYQFVEIKNALTEQFLDRPFSIFKMDRRWLFKQHDLTPFKGQQIRLRFGVANDGQDGRTAMYLDNVSVRACHELSSTTSVLTSAPLTSPTATSSATLPVFTPTSTPTSTFTYTPIPISTPIPTSTPTPILASTPTPTSTPTTTIVAVPSGPTATSLPPPAPPPTRVPHPTPPSEAATPPPNGCSAPLLNPSFEEYDTHWHVGNDPIPPQPVSEERYSGASSMLLGNPPHYGYADVMSFSSIRQLVTLPVNASTISLRWHAIYRSEESYDSQPGAYYDHQELVLLDTNLNTIAVPYRVRRNDGRWDAVSIDLTPYRGRTLYIYFNVYNDGNGRRSWMYLDYVDLQICYTAYDPIYATAIPITPTPSLAPSATPSPVPTAIPTVTPTETQVATVTLTVIPTVTPMPTATPTSTWTVTAVATDTPVDTATTTATTIAIDTATSTATFTAIPLAPPLPQAATPTLTQPSILVPTVTLTSLPTQQSTQIPVPTTTATEPAQVGVIQGTPSTPFTATVASPTSVTALVTTPTLIVQPTATLLILRPFSTPPTITIPAPVSILGISWGDVLSTDWMRRIGTFAVLISILAIIGLIWWLLWNKFLK